MRMGRVHRTMGERGANSTAMAYSEMLGNKEKGGSRLGGGGSLQTVVKGNPLTIPLNG